MSDIRASTILPARRERVTLRTDDGLALTGELALPADQAPVATLVCLHPLPTQGGMMDNRAVPLRMEIFPSHWSRNRLMNARP